MKVCPYFKLKRVKKRDRPPLNISNLNGDRPCFVFDKWHNQGTLLVFIFHMIKVCPYFKLKRVKIGTDLHTHSLFSTFRIKKKNQVPLKKIR